MSSESSTETTRRIVTDYIRLVFTERDPDTAWKLYVRDEYIQHNPRAADGPQATLDLLHQLLGTPGLKFEVQRILADGEYAAVHLKSIPPTGPTRASCEIYRLKDGYVVEHWDVIQEVPETSANPHPLF